MIEGLFQNTRIPKGGTPLPHPLRASRKASGKEKGKDEDDFQKIIIFANIKSMI